MLLLAPLPHLVATGHRLREGALVLVRTDQRRGHDGGTLRFGRHRHDAHHGQVHGPLAHLGDLRTLTHKEPRFHRRLGRTGALLLRQVKR
jgi:hypothetical protein